MFVDIMNIKESGWHAWGGADGGSGGRTSVRKGKATKSNGSLCCCSKEG